MLNIRYSKPQFIDNPAIFALAYTSVLKHGVAAVYEFKLINRHNKKLLLRDILRQVSNSVHYPHL
jgi:hypothetical protein